MERLVLQVREPRMGVHRACSRCASDLKLHGMASGAINRCQRGIVRFAGHGVALENDSNLRSAVCGLSGSVGRSD
jgi:hypothetical protein